jgi:STE24 endopeptidase
MWVWIFTGVVGFFWLLDFWFYRLNSAHSRSAPIDEELRAEWSGERKERALAYLEAKGRFALWYSGTLAILALLVLHSRFYLWVAEWTTVGSERISSLLFLAFFFLVQWVLAIPFDAYATFRLEEKFGFNRTSGKTFFADKLKELLLSVLLGGFILFVVISVFTEFQQAWLLAWGFFVVVQVLLSFLAPVLLLPLFFRLDPLPEGELRTAILAMAERLAFPVRGLFVMDGSRRSAKANAFFTGFGRNRRIVLFDTLIEKHNKEELVAVLAHEIGHAKLKHIPVGMVLSFLATGLFLFCFDLLYRAETLHSALGWPASFHSTAMLAFFLFPLLSFFVHLLQNAISRANEFAADAFAVRAVGNGGALVNALTKLSKDQLSNLYPHPWVVKLEYTHPPLAQRIRAIRAIRVGK